MSLYKRAIMSAGSCSPALYSDDSYPLATACSGASHALRALSFLLLMRGINDLESISQMGTPFDVALVTSG